MTPAQRLLYHQINSFVKSILKVPDGLWKKVDICPAGNALGVRGVVFVEVLRLYMWYVVKPQQTCNEVDRTFYESIKGNNCPLVNRHRLRLNDIETAEEKPEVRTYRVEKLPCYPLLHKAKREILQPGLASCRGYGYSRRIPSTACLHLPEGEERTCPTKKSIRPMKQREHHFALRFAP
jgi:hypothetical protein